MRTLKKKTPKEITKYIARLYKSYVKPDLDRLGIPSTSRSVCMKLMVELYWTYKKGKLSREKINDIKAKYINQGVPSNIFDRINKIIRSVCKYNDY